jgi:hypothetical protein
MLQVGFEHMIRASSRPEDHALDRAANWTLKERKHNDLTPWGKRKKEIVSMEKERLMQKAANNLIYLLLNTCTSLRDCTVT